MEEQTFDAERRANESTKQAELYEAWFVASTPEHFVEGHEEKFKETLSREFRGYVDKNYHGEIK